MARKITKRIFSRLYATLNSAEQWGGGGSTVVSTMVKIKTENIKIIYAKLSKYLKIFRLESLPSRTPPPLPFSPTSHVYFPMWGIHMSGGPAIPYHANQTILRGSAQQWVSICMCTRCGCCQALGDGVRRFSSPLVEILGMVRGQKIF
jgi:hypothetical protein